MHSSRFNSLALVTIALLLPLVAACGGRSGDDGTGGGSGDDSGVQPGADTSGYEGKLSWSLNMILGMPSLRVWDLASSSYAARLDSPEDALENYLHPATSRDGSTLVHTFSSGAITDSDFVLEIARVDLATGAVTRVPRDTGTPDQVRFSQQASVSGDGSAIAFSQFMATYSPDLVPDSQTDGDIAIVVDGGEPQALTTSDAEDTCPKITADGQSVIFWSDRDFGDGDLYRVAATEGATVERLSYAAHPDITGFSTGLRSACAFDVSDDGARLAFLGRTDEGAAVFVMDTATKAIERVSTIAHGSASAFSLSGDGTRIAFMTSAKLAEGTEDEETVMRLYAAELGGSATLLLESSFVDVTKPNALMATSASSLALSRDGSALATMLSNPERTGDEIPMKLVVMRFDGSDIRTVTAVETDLSLYGASGLTF
jgi:Tol biopolymer transport system component